HQPVRSVTEGESLGGRVRERRKITIGIERERASLSVGRNNGRRPTAGIAFDRGYVMIAVLDGGEASLSVIGEQIPNRPRKSIQRPQMPSAIVEHVNFTAIFRGNQNLLSGKTRQGGTHLANPLVEPIRDIQTAVRAESDSDRIVQLRLSRRTAIAGKPGDACAGDRGDD